MNDFLKKMFIDEAKPALDRHSGSGSSVGGGIVEVDVLPSPTILDPNNSGPVPNTGYVEKVYFNTSLSEEEVLAELDKLTYAEGMPINVLLLKPDQSMILAVMKQDAMCAIANFVDNTYYWVNSDLSTQIQLPYVGWNPDFNGELEINSEVIAEFEGIAGGTENDKITNLFYMGVMVPNPDFDPEAVYQLPDETLWMCVNDEWIELVERPDLESLNVTENGTYIPSVENTYYSDVTVDVQPSLETLEITTNGSHDVTDYKNAEVSGIPSEDEIKIITNGIHDVSNYKNANVLIATEGALLKSLFDFTKSSANLFYEASDVTEIPSSILAYDSTSNVTDMNHMFCGCTSLTVAPEIDTSNVNDMHYMFYNCKSLTVAPEIDTSKVTNMNYMFGNCTSLTVVPELDTSKVQDFNGMFNTCPLLTTVEKIDMNSATSNVNMFGYNTTTNLPNAALTNLTLLNIRANLTIGSGTTWGHLLTLDSLINTCKECIKQSSSRKLTVGSANLEKLADVYVKFTDSTVTTIVTGKKGEVEVCESTDEGAMTIETYMSLKSWTLA